MIDKEKEEEVEEVGGLEHWKGKAGGLVFTARGMVADVGHSSLTTLWTILLLICRHSLPDLHRRTTAVSNGLYQPFPLLPQCTLTSPPLTTTLSPPELYYQPTPDPAHHAVSLALLLNH